MAEYIDRTKLLKRLTDYYNSIAENEFTSLSVSTASDCLFIINEQPTVDAVEIVRCKDCVFSETVDDEVKKSHSSDCIKCTKYSTDCHTVLMHPSDYCSCSKQKYDPVTGTVNIRIDTLSDKQRELLNIMFNCSECTDDQIQQLKLKYHDILTINIF